MRCIIRRCAIISTLTLTSLAALSAEAQAAKTPPFLREADRPIAFMWGLGPGFGVTDNIPDVFKFTQDLMFHFRKSAAGPALGFNMQEGFLNGGGFSFQTGPKFEYDIQVKKGLAVYITPSIGFGYHGMFFDNWNNHGAYIHPGVAVKTIFVNRWMVWLAPHDLDVIIGGGNNVRIRVDFRFGGGVIF